jgi:hypothetical protein
VAPTRNSSAAKLVQDSTPVGTRAAVNSEEKRAEQKRRFEAAFERLRKSAAHDKLLIELSKR